MRMSRFSGYSSGASTTGQRSWGKSDSNTQKAWQSQIGKTKLAVSPYRVSLRAYLRFTISPPPQLILHTSAKCFEEGVNLLLPYPTGSLLSKQ